MDNVKRFFELKELWKKATEEERVDIDRQVEALLQSMDDSEIPDLEVAVTADLRRIGEDVENIGRVLTARKLLEPVLPFISVSALAREYFGKSSSWFYQRLNGNIVHGKTVAFTQEEMETLTHALNDIAAKLQQAAISVA